MTPSLTPNSYREDCIYNVETSMKSWYIVYAMWKYDGG